MTAINIKPIFKTDSAASAGTASTFYFQVPASKRWLLGIIDLEFGTSNTVNTVQVQVGIGTSTSLAAIMPSQNGGFVKMSVDLMAKYPRSVELEANDTVGIVWVRSGVNTTITATLFAIESDL